MTETPEEYATRAAIAYKRAENRLADLAQMLGEWPASIPVGPVTHGAILGLAQGAAGLVKQSHLIASPYDPRLQTEEGGDGK